jgi:aminoacrylate hydrolase
MRFTLAIRRAVLSVLRSHWPIPGGSAAWLSTAAPPNPIRIAIKYSMCARFSTSTAWYINANHEILAAEEAKTAKILAPPEVQASRLDAILAFDRTGELSRLDLPTLVLCARDDILTPAYFSEELARLIPNARLHLLATGGHACSRTVTEEFNRVVLDFLTGAG